MRRLLLLTALASLVAAGCVAPGTQSPTTPTDPQLSISWAEKALPYGKKHDHFDPAQHAGLSTPNFEVLGWDPLLLESKGGSSAGGYFCGEAATKADGQRIAVVNSYTTDVAFVVIDVTDPAAPHPLGEYILTGGFAYDVGLTADGLHVIVGNNPKEPEAPSALLGARLVQPQFRDACTGEVRNAGPEQMIPLGPSTLMVSIKDPKNPILEDVQPAPFLGPHSVSTASVDKTTFVVSSITNLAHSASYYQFFIVTDTPLGAKLELQSVYQAPPPADSTQPVVNGHVDASIMKHPITNKVLAYLADWDAGVIILDITNPRAPMFVSQFSEFTGGSYLQGQESGNVHETLPVEGLWDGKHYLIAGQEILSHPADHPTGWIYILDDTDPADLKLVGKWTLPVDAEWSSLTFSTHYVSLVNRTMFVTMYHGGLWAVDLSTEEKLADPPTIGVFLPDKVSPKPPKGGGHGVEGTPDVLDALPFPDGSIAVFDASSGVYMVRFNEAMPITAPPTWLESQAAG